MEDRVSKVSSKMLTNFDAKHIKEIRSILVSSVTREEDFGFSYINSLTRGLM